MDQYDLMLGEECHDNLQDTYDASSDLGVSQGPPRPLICENSFSHSLLDLPLVVRMMESQG